MKFFIALLFVYLNFVKAHSQNLQECQWQNKTGTPCITIFSLQILLKLLKDRLENGNYKKTNYRVWVS